MQDYELLVLAAGRDSSFATQAAIQVGCAGNPNPGDANANCFHSWSTNPDTLLQMRIQLAQRVASR